MKLQTCMETLQKELELQEPLLPNTQGAYSITFDEGMEVTLHEYALSADQPHEPGIAMTAVITSCGEKTAPALYQSALLGNLFGVATKQSIIGLSANGKNLTLCREIEYNCDYTDFKDILEDFLNTVELWRETAALQTKAA